MFIHIFDSSDKVILENLNRKPGKLTSLATGKQIKYKYNKGRLEIDMAGVARVDLNTVLSLAVKAN